MPPVTSAISVLKACVGGYVGTGGVHPAVLDAAREALAEAKGGGVLDGYVARCGDDLALIVLHDGSDDAVRALGRDAFSRSGVVGLRLGQHHAPTNGGPPIQSVGLDVGPRTSEPVLCFLADKAGPGAWNVYLYRTFADPFNTPNLVTDEVLRSGFRFTVFDRREGRELGFDLPAELYDLLAVAGTPDRYVITEVRSRATGDVAAVASTGADPGLLVRAEAPFPAVGEVLEAFAFPYAVTGWLEGTYVGPLMPVSTSDETSTRFDGPPRAIGLGFQVADQRLVGPRDLLGDRAFEDVRRQALQAADYLRRHGPFAPHRVAPA